MREKGDMVQFRIGVAEGKRLRDRADIEGKSHNLIAREIVERVLNCPDDALLDALNLLATKIGELESKLETNTEEVKQLRRDMGQDMEQIASILNGDA